MKRILVIAFTVGIASATVVTLYAQQPHAEHQAAPSRAKAAPSSGPSR